MHAGIDELLAKHIAHLWIRDPLTLFSKKIELDDEKVSDHFEVIDFKWDNFSYLGIIKLT